MALPIAKEGYQNTLLSNSKAVNICENCKAVNICEDKKRRQSVPVSTLIRVDVLGLFDVTIFWYDVIVNFFDAVLFLFSSLVTGPSFMSISSLVMELWQFSFMRDWPEIPKSEIPPSEFFWMSGYWDKLWIPNLVRLSLIKCYWILNNKRLFEKSHIKLKLQLGFSRFEYLLLTSNSTFMAYSRE